MRTPIEVHWLLSEKGVNRILSINSVLCNRTIVEATKYIEHPVARYTPWLSNLENLPGLQPLLMPHCNNLFVTDQNQLKLIARYYNEETVRTHGKGIAIDTSGNLRGKHLAVYEQAYELLIGSDPLISRLARELILKVIPAIGIGGVDQQCGSGFSTHFAKGAIFLSMPQMGKLNWIELAINMAHELGHQVLMRYQSTQDPIVDKDCISQPIFSGVRKTERPAIQSFHALVALYFMLYFVRSVENSTRLNAEERLHVSLRRKEIYEALTDSLPHFEAVPLTKLGSEIFADCVGAVA